MLRIGVVLTVLVVLSSCASVNVNDSLIGVYKITERQCVGAEFERAACEAVKFIEFVEGSFYKIEDYEYAFAIWSGGGQLTYNARKVDQEMVTDEYPFEVEISNDSGYAELVRFQSQGVGEYIHGEIGNSSTLKFVEASENDLVNYEKKYPGNK